MAEREKEANGGVDKWDYREGGRKDAGMRQACGGRADGRKTEVL